MNWSRAISGPGERPARLLRGRSGAGVGEDLDLLAGDQAVTDHAVELGQDGSKPGFLVHDLDQDRQILGQTQDSCREKVRLGADGWFKGLPPRVPGRAGTALR